jgi:hypothetical protein
MKKMLPSFCNRYTVGLSTMLLSTSALAAPFAMSGALFGALGFAAIIGVIVTVATVASAADGEDNAS